MRWYFLVVAVQGTMQVAIIVVTARFATGCKRPAAARITG